MAPIPKQNTKPVFKTASPFTETKWPELSHDDELVILELLSNLVTPLGDHRRTHIQPSKGKKRKRTATTTKPHQDDSTMAETLPPPPAIGKYLLVGLNSVTRHLEGLAAKNAPATSLVASAGNESASCSKDDHHDVKEKDPAKASADDDLRPLSMVILTHPKPSLSPAHAHLPTLVHLSTLVPPSATQDASRTATRLVPLPTSAEGRLASSLHIPRVGALAIYADAPGAKALEDYVREHVGMTECKWVEEAMSAEWQGMNVKREMPRAS